MKEAMDPNDRTILRPNFDTLYSALILGLSRPAIISMPITKGRYQSALVISKEHYIYRWQLLQQLVKRKEQRNGTKAIKPS